MKTINVAAAASLAVILSILISPVAKAQTVNRAQLPNAPAAQAAPSRTPVSPDHADLYTRTPRFMVKLWRFDVIDETGSTDIGSDEVIIVYDTPNYWMRTRQFGDLDSGESRNIEVGEQCVYPARDPDNQSNQHWACINQGAPGPVHFTISLREIDGDLARIYVCENIHRHRNDIIARGDCSLSTYDYDPIGYVSRDFTVAQLVNALPREWATQDFTIDVGGHNSRYRLHYTITRTSDLIEAPAATSQ